MFRTAGIAAVVVVAATASSSWGQCQAGGGGGTSARGGMAASTAGSVGGPIFTSPGGSGYGIPGQALQQQLAMQQYQKLMADKQRRAENLALRQYWAAQRREQKAKSVELTSPGQLAARPAGNSSGMSLDFSSGNR
jgi:hypothetical protein